jgi:hypothetical protein
MHYPSHLVIWRVKALEWAVLCAESERYCLASQMTAYERIPVFPGDGRE